MSNSAAAIQSSETASDLSSHPQAGDTLTTSLTLDSLRTLLQQAGYRVETVSDGNISLLRSASNGVGFDVRLGNSYQGAPGQFADAVFIALFAVHGTFPLDLLNKWNRTHRFGRLFLDKAGPEQEFLALSLDVPVAGGVSPLHLRGQIEIWDSLLQQLVPWLREEVSKIAPTIATASDAAGGATSSASPAS
jgi:hypothetical protein